MLFLVDSTIRLLPLRQMITATYRLGLPISSRFSQVIVTPKLFVQKSLQSVEKIQSLEAKNAELRAQIAQSEFLGVENQALRSQIEKSASDAARLNYQQVVGRVIYSVAESGVDVGTQEGIGEGDLVFWNDRLIGKIGKTSPAFSELHLIDSAQMQLVGENQAGVTGLVRKSSGKVVLDEIASDQLIEVGDYVYSSGSLSEKIPPGLFIGQVSKVQMDLSSPTKFAELDTAPSSDELSVVIIRVYEKN